MAPKGRSKNEDLKQEDVLQAVVIADTFNTQFYPMTLKRPRCLLPLVNVPLIDYTLEALEASGVQEVFVFCCHLGELVREHIKSSKWQEGGSPMTVTTIMSDSCGSVGHALREIEAKSLIRSDFILLLGDTVANIDFSKVMKEHKARLQGRDKSSVMTLLFKVAKPGHRSRSKGEDVILTEEGGTGRLLFFKRTLGERSIQIPSDILLDHDDLRVHNDLLDCHVCICSSIVPTLFTDNFDYQTVDDFVRGILINDEIMGYKIHISVHRDQYASRVSSMHAYDSISKDVMSRWTYPYVPDLFGSSQGERIKYGHHNVYCSEDVTLARGCKLSHNVVVGGGTSIESGTTVSNCVIGKNCHIGRNVSLKNCFIWDNVRLEDDCQADTAVMCSGVRLLKGVTLNKGVILAWDVVVGPNVTIERGTRLMAEANEGTQEEDEGDRESMYGTNSKAFVYKDRVDSDDDEEEDAAVLESTWGVSDDSDGKLSDDEDDESDDKDWDDDDSLDGGDNLDDSLDSGDEAARALGLEPSGWMSQHKVFYKELVDTFQRAISEHINSDNLILEVNSLKHAYTVGIDTLIKSLPCAVFQVSAKQNGSKLSWDQLTLSAIQKNCKQFHGVLTKYIKNEAYQLNAIMGVGDFVIRHENCRPQFPQLLNILYDCGIVEEDVFIKWSQTGYANDHKRRSILFPLAQPFIKWLEEAEEETDDDDDDDDDDE